MDVRADREAAGVSQGDLARRIGWSQTTLSRVEGGARSLTAGEEALIRAALASNGPTDPPVDDPAPDATDDPDTPADAPYLATYPMAPTTPRARREWMRQRNTNFQVIGLRPPPSGTWGARPKSDKK